MSKIKVIKAINYPIYIGEASFTRLNKYINSFEFKYSKFLILLDENVKQFCLPVLIKNADKLKFSEIIEIKSGEENKTIETCKLLWQKLIDLKADRKSVFINLGGGVISDMGGFVASTHMRGIKYINIPTTLLSQVDASIGGKVGVNQNKLKNQIGLFSNPEAVFINHVFLKTLPEKQLLSGFSEIIKHALIADANYWKLIKKQPVDKIREWEDIILRSIEIKNEIVKNDPKEENLRKVLNFGHTFGHAFETFSLKFNCKSLSHGEAVAMGMICESFLSHKIAGLPQSQLDEIVKYILSNFEYYKINKNNINEIFNFMVHDKKRENNNLNFTLISSIGKAVINQNCSNDFIKQCIDYYCSISELL